MHPIVSSALGRARHPDREGLPVAPGWVPVLGHVPALLTAMPWLFREADKLGPLFWIDLGTSRWQLVSAREEAFTIFRNRDTNSAHLARDVGVLVGRSVLGVDGDPHRRMRGAINAPFTPKGLTASKAGALMAELIAPRIEAWRAMDEVPLADETREFAVNVIFRMMGVDATDLAAWRRAFEDFTFTAAPFRWDFPGSPFRRGLRAKAWIDVRLRRITAAARAEDVERSLIAAMVHGRDEQGRGLSEDELLDNLRILVFAGHETTASTMAWAVLYLAQRPACWDRLVEESLALDGPPTNPQQLARSPYAEAVFREALRLRPPVPLDSRETIADWTLLGRAVRPPQVVGVALHQLSRDPERYPEPDAFVPERWLTREKKPTPIETAQFGGGPHFCLGYHVAWLEAVQFLATVARTFGRDGQRPHLVGEMPRAKYFPLQRPPHKTRVRFGR